ncbi:MULTISPECIES: hypothetical protein [unclassified Wolbachia]|uniref:hypothetical protein n=1 Tax=unclassified Wolbachia TaxID=2640676 RepID=UPI003132D309
MKTNIDEPCAGNLQARFFRGSCSNKTQTRGVKLQLLPNKFFRFCGLPGFPTEILKNVIYSYIQIYQAVIQNQPLRLLRYYTRD